MADLLTRLEAEAIAQTRAEKRVIMRLLAYCDALRGERPYPSLEDFNPDAVTGFHPFAFVLDAGEDRKDPVIRFLGEKLIEDSGRDYVNQPISAVPRGCLLMCVADMFDRVFESEGPVIVESNFVDSEGRDRMFRALFMPFGDDGATIESVVGVINSKLKSSKPNLSVVDAEESDGNVKKGPANLADHLAQCQALAAQFQQAHERSRRALYAALERAYAFFFKRRTMPRLTPSC